MKLETTPEVFQPISIKIETEDELLFFVHVIGKTSDETSKIALDHLNQDHPRVKVLNEESYQLYRQLEQVAQKRGL